MELLNVWNAVPYTATALNKQTKRLLFTLLAKKFWKSIKKKNWKYKPTVISVSLSLSLSLSLFHAPLPCFYDPSFMDAVLTNELKMIFANSVFLFHVQQSFKLKLQKQWALSSIFSFIGVVDKRAASLITLVKMMFT